MDQHFFFGNLLKVMYAGSPFEACVKDVNRVLNEQKDYRIKNEAILKDLQNVLETTKKSITQVK